MQTGGTDKTHMLKVALAPPTIPTRKGQKVVGALFERSGDARVHFHAPTATHKQRGFDVIMAQDCAAERGRAA